MPRQTKLLFAFSAILLACGRMSVPASADLPSQSSTILSPPDSSHSFAPEGGQGDQPDSSIHIWSLGGNGWAVRIAEKMLVFDYVGRAGATPPGSGEARNLKTGYIDPGELRAFEVYVFVTHSHQDHYDPAILEWQDQIDQITYFFGWQAGSSNEHHYMIGPRARTQSDDLRVYTINSHHDGVPEVAYLLQVDGITIYHNGDYRASYLEDFEYLRTITDHIDFAFVIGWPYVSHQHFQQAKALAQMFNPTCIFAICRQGDEDKSLKFAQLLTEHGVEGDVQYAKHRGDEFVFLRSALE